MCFEYTALRMEKKLEYKCAQCGAVVYKTKSQVKRNKSGNVFCNSSCAAKYNNSHYRTGKIILIGLMAHVGEPLILLWLLGTTRISVQCVDLKKSAAYRFIILMRIDITPLLII